MKTIYIAGKVTGEPPIATAIKFAAAQSMLEARGHTVVNPVDRIARRKLTHEPWERIMKECIRDLCTCDAIYLLSDWRKSRGALIERGLANDLGMEVIHESEYVARMHEQITQA